MNKDYTPFAVSKDDGRLLVDVRAVMHPMVAFCDGLTVTHFEDGPRRVKALKRALELFAAGKCKQINEVPDGDPT